MIADTDVHGNGAFNVSTMWMDHNGKVRCDAATQVGGTHYQSKKVQPWTAMEAWMTPEQFSGYLRGNVIKYLARCDDKGGVEDLQKAQHYLSKLIEFETKEGN